MFINSIIRQYSNSLILIQRSKPSLLSFSGSNSSATRLSGSVIAPPSQELLGPSLWQRQREARSRTRADTETETKSRSSCMPKLTPSPSRGPLLRLWLRAKVGDLKNLAYVASQSPNNHAHLHRHVYLVTKEGLRTYRKRRMEVVVVCGKR